MDPERFEGILRFLATRVSRRGVIAGSSGGLLTLLPIALAGNEADARRKRRPARRKNRKRTGTKQSPPPGQPACTPACAGKQCGSDGCGGSCGTCHPWAPICTPAGTCAAPCLPDCFGKACGDDGCGGTCGSCTLPLICTADGTGQCVPLFP